MRAEVDSETFERKFESVRTIRKESEKVSKKVSEKTLSQFSHLVNFEMSKL